MTCALCRKLRRSSSAVATSREATANQDKAWKSGANEGTRNGDIHERPEVVSCSARRKVPGKWSSQSMVCALTGTGSIASISPTTDVAGPVKSGAAICALMSTPPKKSQRPRARLCKPFPTAGWFFLSRASQIGGIRRHR